MPRSLQNNCFNSSYISDKPTDELIKSTTVMTPIFLFLKNNKDIVNSPNARIKWPIKKYECIFLFLTQQHCMMHSLSITFLLLRRETL